MDERQLLVDCVWEIILKAQNQHWSRKQLLAAVDQYVMSCNRDGGNIIADIPSRLRKALKQGEIRVYGELD